MKVGKVKGLSCKLLCFISLDLLHLMHFSTCFNLKKDELVGSRYIHCAQYLHILFSLEQVEELCIIIFRRKGRGFEPHTAPHTHPSHHTKSTLSPY